MVSHYCGNRPARSGKSRADLRQALVKEKDRKKRSSSKAQEPYGYLDFARRFHPLLRPSRGRGRRCAYVTTKSQRSRRSARAASDQLRRLCAGGCASSTRTKAASLTRGASGVSTTLRRSCLPAIKQNANQRMPNTIAAKTSGKKYAPQTMRLNPTKHIRNAALKIVSLRQCGAFSTARVKSANCT